MKITHKEAVAIYKEYQETKKEFEEELKKDLPSEEELPTFHAKIGTSCFFDLYHVVQRYKSEDEMERWKEECITGKKEAEDEEMEQAYQIWMKDLEQAEKKYKKIMRHVSYFSQQKFLEKKRNKLQSVNQNKSMSVFFKRYIEETPVFICEDILKMEKKTDQKRLVEDFFDAYSRIKNHFHALEAKMHDFLKYENDMKKLKTYYDAEEIIEKEGMKRFTASTITKGIISTFIESKERKLIEKNKKISKIEEEIKKDCQLKEDLSLYKKYNESDDQGYIYIIREYKSNTYKVGRSRTIKRRSDQFRTKLPFMWEYVAIVPVDHYVKIEAELHVLFQHYRVEGEWFAFDAEKLKECYEKLKEYHQNFKDVK